MKTESTSNGSSRCGWNINSSSIDFVIDPSLMLNNLMFDEAARPSARPQTEKAIIFFQ